MWRSGALNSTRTYPLITITIICSTIFNTIIWQSSVLSLVSEKAWFLRVIYDKHHESYFKIHQNITSRELASVHLCSRRMQAIHPGTLRLLVTFLCSAIATLLPASLQGRWYYPQTVGFIIRTVLLSHLGQKLLTSLSCPTYKPAGFQNGDHSVFGQSNVDEWIGK